MCSEAKTSSTLCTDEKLQVELLRSFIVEDRSDIRAIERNLPKYAYSLAAASFAVSAFVLARCSQPVLATILIVICDIIIVALIWAIYTILLETLISLRKALKVRQRALEAFFDARIPRTDPFTPFPLATNVVPDIDDSDLRKLTRTAIAAVAVKSAAITIGYLAFGPLSWR